MSMLHTNHNYFRSVWPSFSRGQVIVITYVKIKISGYNSQIFDLTLTNYWWLSPVSKGYILNGFLLSLLSYLSAVFPITLSAVIAKYIICFKIESQQN